MYRVVISRLSVTNTKALLTLSALIKMTEPAKKTHTMFCSMFKNVPNLNETSSSDSTLLLNNTSVTSKANRARSQLYIRNKNSYLTCKEDENVMISKLI